MPNFTLDSHLDFNPAVTTPEEAVFSFPQIDGERSQKTVHFPQRDGFPSATISITFTSA
jgi:hypothetical protein